MVIKFSAGILLCLRNHFRENRKFFSHLIRGMELLFPTWEWDLPREGANGWENGSIRGTLKAG
jgi:hypothetical protein